MISEEMRVLYVALTRAKEKLIITGLEKDYQKSINKKEEILNSYKNGNMAINKNITEKYIKYLDWMELVYINRKKELDKVLNLHIHKKQEILKNKLTEETKKTSIEDMLKDTNKEQIEEIRKKLEWKYCYKTNNSILTKSSVTQIKSMKSELEVEYKMPEFLKEQKGLTGAEKGILMHLVLQKLDEKLEYDKDKIQNLLEELKNKCIINEKEMEAIDIEKIYKFTKSIIWKDMKEAKEVQKEKPFYINMPVKEVYKEDIEENILVQGIIDLYYITREDKLVLVDYKTDRVEKKEGLIEKYNEQLKIYKQALEKSLGRKVDKVYIYSIFLGKDIEIFV